MSAKSKLKFTLFFVATKNLIGGNVIKLKENFDIELSELLDMDDKFVQILDIFEVEKMKQLIEKRGICWLFIYLRRQTLENLKKNSVC